MKTPIKIAVAVVVLAPLAYVGSSWYAGKKAQELIEDWVAQANADIEAQWVAKDNLPSIGIASYARGIFDSQVSYELKFTDPEGKLQSFGLKDHLQHGPWPRALLEKGDWQLLAAYSDLRPAQDGAWLPWYQRMPEGQAPWALQSRVGFDGRVSSVGAIEALDLPDEGLQFSGADLQAEFSAQNRTLQMAANISQIIIQEPSEDARMSLQGLSFKAESSRGAASDLQSSVDGAIKQLSLAIPDIPEAKAQELGFALKASQKDNLLASQASYSIGSLQYGANEIGQMQLELAANNLPVAELGALSKMLDDLDDVDELSTEQERAVMQLLAPVLAASPKLTLDKLRWQNTKGQTQLKSELAFRPVALQDQDIGEMLEDAIARLGVQFSLSKPMILEVVRVAQDDPDESQMAVALASMFFDRYAGQLERLGLVRREGDEVLADYRYADGVVNVNGQDMSFEEFAELVSEVPGLD